MSPASGRRAPARSGYAARDIPPPPSCRRRPRAVRLAVEVAQELAVSRIVAQYLALLALLVGRLGVARILELHEVRPLDALVDALREGGVVSLELVDAAVGLTQVAYWEQDDLLKRLRLNLRTLIHPDIARRLRRHRCRERQRRCQQESRRQIAHPCPSLHTKSP